MVKSGPVINFQKTNYLMFLLEELTVTFSFPALAAEMTVHGVDNADGRAWVAAPAAGLVAVRVTAEVRVFNN